MKTLLFSYKFLFMTLMSLPLALCSSDNDYETPFEPVTIDLSSVDVALEDTFFTVNGFQFNARRVSTDEVTNDGILLAYPENGEGSLLELDLSTVAGISKITLSIFNNNGDGTVVSLWNNGTLVEERSNLPNATSGNLFKDTSLSVSGKQIDLLRITSFEATIRSIKLE